MNIFRRGQRVGGSVLGRTGYCPIAPRDPVHVGSQAKVYVTKTLCLVSCERNLSTGLSPTMPHLNS